MGMRTITRMAAVAGLAAVALASETVRLSVTEQGFECNGTSDWPSVTPDGRFVAFSSFATNLGFAEGNTSTDVFVRDRASGQVWLVSRAVGSDTTGNNSSVVPSISADGRYVAFESLSSDLVPGDTNNKRDVFRGDVLTGDVIRVSVSTSGTEGNELSANAAISGNGRYVAFESYSTNLVPGDANGLRDIFVHDTVTGTTEIVSLAESGAQVNGPCSRASISEDGSLVTFDSSATNAVLNDTNGTVDVFLRDRNAGTTTRISTPTFGGQLNGPSSHAALAANGEAVAFKTEATNIFLADGNSGPDACVKSLVSGALTVITHSSSSTFVAADGPSHYPSISSDARWVAFASNASNLVAGDTNGTQDVFRYDRTTGVRARMSVAGAGSQSAGTCYYTSLTDAGEVVFMSDAVDLVSGDSGTYSDLFVRNLGPDFPQLYCSGKMNSLGCVPFLNFDGTPSTTSTVPFRIRGHDFLPSEAGFMFYSVNGKSNLDFHGGKLCVKLPFKRWLPVVKAKNNGTAPCSGIMSKDFNLRIQSGADPQLTAGQTVHAQWLQRDPADPAGFSDGLSNGIQFTIGS